MTKLERIQKKYEEISVIFADEYDQVVKILEQGDFTQNLEKAISKRKATTKALRNILKLKKQEEQKMLIKS